MAPGLVMAFDSRTVSFVCVRTTRATPKLSLTTNDDPRENDGSNILRTYVRLILFLTISLKLRKVMPARRIASPMPMS